MIQKYPLFLHFLSGYILIDDKTHAKETLSTKFMFIEINLL